MKYRSLVGRLSLSSALVAVSLAYGWWQRHNAGGPATATMPIRARAAKRLVLAPTPFAMAARPESGAPAALAAPAAALQRDLRLPAAPSAAPLTALATLEMYQPPPVQSPLPLVTGMPVPGATPPIPPGAHLEDGDYLSDVQQYEWGDLTVKISVHGGQITGVQVVQYPDHRPESLELSQMASPILDSEVIKSQQANVDVVSSATDTSVAFQYAIASAIKKATR